MQEFIIVNAYIKKKISNQQPKFTTWGTRIKAKPNASRRKEIIIIRMEINKLENEETVDRINKACILFFKKINKIDKSLSRLTKKKKGRFKS